MHIIPIELRTFTRNGSTTQEVACEASLDDLLIVAGVKSAGITMFHGSRDDRQRAWTPNSRSVRVSVDYNEAQRLVDEGKARFTKPGSSGSGNTGTTLDDLSPAARALLGDDIAGSDVS